MGQVSLEDSVELDAHGPVSRLVGCERKSTELDAYYVSPFLCMLHSDRDFALMKKK